MGATPASLLATVFAPCLGGAWGLGEPRGPGPAGGSLDQDPAMGHGPSSLVMVGDR